jgi:hypothetical protein
MTVLNLKNRFVEILVNNTNIKNMGQKVYYPLHIDFLLGLPLHPPKKKDGDNMFLGNVGRLSIDNTGLFTRR